MRFGKYSIIIGAIIVLVGVWFFYRNPKIDTIKVDGALSKTSPQNQRKFKRLGSKDAAFGPKPIETKNKLEKVTPENALALIDDFKSRNQDMSAKTLFCSKIIRELCENGYSIEAWDIIEPGLGSVRFSQLSAFFLAAKLSTDELFDRLKTIESGGEMVSCFGYFLTRYKPSEFSDFLTSQRFKDFADSPNSKLSKDNISSSISLVLQRNLNDSPPAQVNNITNTISTMLSNGFLNPDDLLALLSKDNLGGPFVAWDLIKAVDIKHLAVGVSRDTRDHLIAKMVYTDAPQTITKIFENGGDNFSHDIDVVISSWANIDSEGATSWYTQNLQSLTTQQRGAVAFAFSKAAMSSLEFNGAEQWALQIQDVTMRDAAIKAIADKRDASK